MAEPKIATENAKEQAQDIRAKVDELRPFAIDYSAQKKQYRTIINAPSADLALQKFAELASSSSLILALYITTKNEVESARPVLIRLNNVDTISIDQVGIAHLPENAPKDNPKTE